MRMILRAVLLLCLAAGVAQAQAPGRPARPSPAPEPAPQQSPDRPIRTIAPTRLLVSGQMGWGTLPIHVVPDWVQPQPDIQRVVILLHDLSRDTSLFMRIARKTRDAAGAIGQDTMLVVPQFLAPVDLLAHNLPASILRWRAGEWVRNGQAHGPSLLPSYAALDTIMERLASLRLFPDLRLVVIVGHGEGGEMVQRYAAVGKGQAFLDEREIKVRYVVANPDSYLYFRPDRPEAVETAACADYNAWPYGLERPPLYVAEAAKVEAVYAGRDVVYLLGTADNSPATGSLDNSCAAMAQGPHRLARGLAMDTLMRKLHGPDLRHRVLQAPGVGHDAEAVFASPCGLEAVFDIAGCDKP